jgi:hypothetical protein
MNQQQAWLNFERLLLAVHRQGYWIAHNSAPLQYYSSVKCPHVIPTEGGIPKHLANQQPARHSFKCRAAGISRYRSK